MWQKGGQMLARVCDNPPSLKFWARLTIERILEGMNMPFNKGLVSLLGGAIFIFWGGAGTALAQGDEAQPLEEVIVTGSRIRDINVVSSSQVTTIEIEDISDRGITRVEDYLNDLPQISPGQAITASNGSNGRATVDLRNLGCSRTLVLINGQRMAPGGTAGGNCADLNAVPSLLLDRVEVLTGGASSVYGSDAVAGVVNFIIDEEFEGFKASVTHSFYQHNNDNGELRDLVRSYDYALADEDITTGDTTKLAVAFGGSAFDGRGHITGYIEKTDTQPILQGDYDISACALTRGKGGCGGSSTIPPGRWADFGGYRRGGFVNIDPSVTGLDQNVQGDEFVPRSGKTFNYNPTNFFQRPDDRLNAGFFGHFEINENAEAYASVRSMSSESNAQIAYSGTFGNITALPCYNALLSKQQYDTVCGNWMGMIGDHAPNFTSGAEALNYINGLSTRVGEDDQIFGYSAPLYSLKRNVEGAPRQSITLYDNLTQVYGVRGDIAGSWTYDVNYQLSEVNYVNEYRNDLSVTNINRAIDVVNVNGVPTCVSVLNGTDSNCIPYNLFSGGQPGDGGIDAVRAGGQDLQSYIAQSTFIRGSGKQRILQGVVSGETGITIPGAPSSISAAFGYETKELKTDYSPDAPSIAGDRSGSGGAAIPLSGAYDVNELFMEFGIPVMDNLSLDAGYRYADYSTGHTTDTFKLGAFFRASEDIALRGSFQSAIRHGNLSNLYTAQGDSLTDLPDDPCGLNMTASQAQCANTGLSAANYGTDLKSPADQYNIRYGGNPNVAPEEAESITLGAVLTPRFLDGLTLTVDYFDISIEEGIGSIPAATSLNKCLETGQAVFCNNINRHPGSGSLWLTGGYISTQTTNITESWVSGVDFIFDYSFDTPLGPMDIEGVTTNVLEDSFIELPGEPTTECAGNWGLSCGKNPVPEWSGNYKATLYTDYDIRVSLAMRYLAETNDLGGNNIDFDAETYWDLTAVWSASENYTATVGVSNLLDTDPQVTSDAGTQPGNGNTFPAYFDALGRYVFVNLGVNF
ncbi:MAG: TonB-dependent receptor plug domain-containing protein [Gammaproteobacteria bacterium]|nr:TonB-dependent receptor plug domain-containing protein [Gammaproteobacteria bacterium]